MTGNGQYGQLRARKFLTGVLAIGALVGVYCLATAGVSGLLMTATGTTALAGPHGHSHGGHWGGHGWGGRGHFWHGRWWGYGIGPCWRWTPIGWVWIC